MFWRRKKTDSQSDGHSKPDVEPEQPQFPLLDQARMQAAAGQDVEALGTLKVLFQQEPTLRPAYILAAQILDNLSAPDEAKLFGDAARDLSDPGPLYDLGYHFFEVGQPDFAVIFLQRAFDLAPLPRIASELSVALNSLFRPEEAAAALEQASLSGPLPFWDGYQLAWSNLLCGRPEPAWQLLRTPLPEMTGQAKEVAPRALDRLRQVAERLVAVGQPQPMIRDWHFIQYGSVILDFMDERTAADAWDVAGGRWVMLSAGPDKVHAVVLKLRQLLKALALRPKQVVGLPDRDSQIVAQVAALLFELPLVEYTERSAPDQLLIAADASALSGAALRQVSPGQITFALNLDWLCGGGLVPDVVGVLSQMYLFPWNGGLGRHSPETGEMEAPEPDQREPALIAADIVRTEPEADPDFGRHLAFYLVHRAHLAAGRAGAVRQGWRRDSPVPGRFFG